jgi:hypothetical protein
MLPQRLYSFASCQIGRKKQTQILISRVKDGERRNFCRDMHPDRLWPIKCLTAST